MRLGALAIAAIMVLPALAQEGQVSDQPDIFEQERFDTEAGNAADAPESGDNPERQQNGSAEPGRTMPDEAVRDEATRNEEDGGSSVIVRRPGEGGIEVSPLAPPGAELDEAETGPEALDDDESISRPPDDHLPEAERNEDGQGPGFRRPSKGPAVSAEHGGIAIPIEQVATASRAGVRLRELDKMTGRTETVDLPVGETHQLGRLKIAVEDCRSPETNDPHGTFAFLKVWDVRSTDEGESAEEEAFSGWMFAQSPSLSALDHPRYDLWVISCTMSDADVSSDSE